MRTLLAFIAAVVVWALPAFGQAGPKADFPASAPPATGGLVGGEGGNLDSMNPLSILSEAGRVLPGGGGGSGASDTGGSSSGKTATPSGGLSTAINVVIVLTIISLVPSIVLMCTCFLRIVVVLGLLKQALGTQQMPPSQVMLGLSLVLTFVVMAPTVSRINKEAIAPYRAGEIKNYDDLWDAGKSPVRDFMFDQIDAAGNYSSLYMILNYRGVDTSDPSKLTRKDVDMVTLVPAFILSELKVAFLMGFRIMLPFLVIDLVISAILIAMNMMMLPPVLISLPFKLLLFVLVDGWQLIVGSLLHSFKTGAPVPIAPSTSTSLLYEHAHPVLASLGLA
ncbi:MAG: flagellar type III secretion system pore protein FliP [Phycisphaerales bacterium]